jgi:hypothetical protein
MTASLDEDLLDALIGRVDAAIGTLAKLGIKSAPLPPPVAGRSADRADYVFALWQASETAVESAGSDLTSADRKKARAACDSLFLVASTFDWFIEARRNPLSENLAFLVILGARLARTARNLSSLSDVIRGPKGRGSEGVGPKGKSGRPKGSTIYAKSDEPLVQKLRERIAAGERPTVAAMALEAEAAGPIGRPGSKAKRLLRALYANTN